MRRQKSEWLIALTQTEIMFILASVILILLLAQRHNFEAERAAAKRAAQETAQAAESAQEITQTLRRAGLIPAAADSRAAPEKEAAGAVRRLVEEKQEINRVLRRAGESPRTEAQVKQLQTAAAQAGAELTKVRNENEEMKQEIEDLKRRLAQGGEAEAALARRVRAQQGEISRLRVGFAPCWPRRGRPPYYFAYRIVYDRSRERFRISPHPDLQSEAPVVAAALAGDLAVVKRHPQGWMSRAELAVFGARLKAAKIRFYGDYGEECRLAVQINDAGQAAIEFIRDQAVLFPVYE